MMFKKILGTVLAAAFAASMIVSPASAHNPNQKGPISSIFPALLGPVAAASAIGTSSTVASWFTTKFIGWKWVYTGHKWVWTHHGWKWQAQYDKVKNFKQIKHSKTYKSKLKVGKVVVGCVMGSALGAISASIRKATALGNPPKWRSQADHERIVASGAEKKYELTSDEAQTALALCGAGSFALHWPQGNI
jgi:hypothetical protein